MFHVLLSLASLPIKTTWCIETIKSWPRSSTKCHSIPQHSKWIIAVLSKTTKTFGKDCLFYSGWPKVCKWLQKKKKCRQLKLGGATYIHILKSIHWALTVTVGDYWIISEAKYFLKRKPDQFQSISVQNRVPKPLPTLLYHCPALTAALKTSWHGSSMLVCLPFSRRARWNLWKIIC